MSDTTLALIITGIILAVLFAWVPLLHRAEALTLRYSRKVEEEMPDLREDDFSPQLSWRREVA